MAKFDYGLILVSLSYRQAPAMKHRHTIVQDRLVYIYLVFCNQIYLENSICRTELEKFISN